MRRTKTGRVAEVAKVAEFVGPPKPPPTAGELAAQARGEFQRFLDRHLDRNREAMDKFRSKVNEPNASIDYAIRWGVQDAVVAEHVLRDTATTAEILAGKKTGPDGCTPETVLDYAREQIKRRTRELISEDRYFPNCTCPIVNLFRLYEQKASQQVLKFYQAVEFWLTYIAELDGRPPDQPGPFRYPSYEFDC